MQAPKSYDESQRLEREVSDRMFARGYPPLVDVVYESRRGEWWRSPAYLEWLGVKQK
jgi:hypothetical protein